MKSALPIACNMDVFTPDQRDAHLQLASRLFGKVLNITAMQGGYEFNLPNETDNLLDLGAFIAYERLCCPFLEFSLNVKPGDEPITLSLSGPEGTPEFLRAEFSEAFV